jgi:hypothetical protein
MYNVAIQRNAHVAQIECILAQVKQRYALCIANCYNTAKRRSDQLFLQASCASFPYSAFMATIRSYEKVCG